MKNTKIVRLLPILLILFSVSCSQKSKDEKYKFNELTSLIYPLEESNRIEFKKLFLKKGVELSDFQLEVINLYNQIDKVVEELLNQSGGYDEDGVMIGGSGTEIGKEILLKHNLINNIENNLLKLEDSKNLALKEYKLNDLKSSLSFLQHMKRNRLDNMTVAKIYLGLIITQNRMLVIGLKYPK